MNLSVTLENENEDKWAKSIWKNINSRNPLTLTASLDCWFSFEPCSVSSPLLHLSRFILRRNTHGDTCSSELLSSPIYSALGCFMNNSRTVSDRDLIVFLLERGHRGSSICIKFGRSTNWPIRWFFARDFDDDFLGPYSVSMRLVNTPFNSGPFYLWNKLLMTIPSRFFQELQGFRKDQETS